MKKLTIEEFFELGKEEKEKALGEVTKKAIAEHHKAGRATTHADVKGIYKLFPDGRKEYVKKSLPETYKGYSTKDLLKTWEEIKSPKGTNSPKDQIRAMSQLLREYKLGLFGIKRD